MGRGDDRHPVLDHRRDVCGARPRGVLRGVGGRRVKSPDWLSDADRASEWSALSVVVAGIGVSGFAAADALLGLGATVTIVDEREGEAENDRARVLEILGAKVRLDQDPRPAYRTTHSWWSLHRDGAQRRRCWWRPAGRASRSGERSNWPGICAISIVPRRGLPSPAPTARRRPCECSPRCSGRRDCGRPRPATWAIQWSRRCCIPSHTTSSRSSCRATSCTGSPR